LVLLLLLALVLSASSLLAACSDNEGNGGTETSATENGSTDGSSDGDGSTDGSSPETPDEPGLYEQADGTVLALGILIMREEEGGYWAVVDTTDPAKAADADVLAVLGSSEEIAAPINSYKGKFVSVTGIPRENDVYQAGQFVELQSIKVVAGTGQE
jgi:hypothetical protein